MPVVRLTAAQALVRYLANQINEDGERFVFGVWAIFGHGNVAGLGEALQGIGDDLPTYRGHNEQSMGHAAIAYAKANRRRKAMAVTTSIGPGATNLVSAAATAHVNRLPLLLIPGDVFAKRGPDPVLQQVEDFGDGTVSANDCFRPVSRYFDRIARPGHLLTALPRAMRVLTDPADCGPVTLAFCQDVQTEAFDYPDTFFVSNVWHQRRLQPDRDELASAVSILRAAKSPLLIAGGGVHYSDACSTLRSFVEKHQIPVGETQAGKSALPWDHHLNFGPIGVSGAAGANALAQNADVILGVGTRFQDITTGSWVLFQNPDRKLLSLNVQPYDGTKHAATALVADARVGLEALSAAMGRHKFPLPDAAIRADWFDAVDGLTAAPADNQNLPTDMQVIGAVQRAARDNTVVMCAAGTMPGELHKLWKAGRPGSYHMEYGYSCMGYEIAGSLGIKMAEPNRDVVVMVGDGSYLMMNSELATAVTMGIKITVVVVDNRGFGCINRLQIATGGKEFNNLLDHTRHVTPSKVDFVAHAASMGAHAEKADSIAELEDALGRARNAQEPCVIVIDTDPFPSSEAGGHWWDIPVPEVSERVEVRSARADYEAAVKGRWDA